MGMGMGTMLVSLMICVLWIMPVYGLGNTTIITGMVFCDICKDGVVSLNDYPLSGINVTMVCPRVDLPTHFPTHIKTGNFGIYGIAFQGSPDMGKCKAWISLRNNAAASNNFCMASTSPNRFPRLLTPITSELGEAIYYFDPLITQPMEPLSTCAGSPSPSPLPPAPSPAMLIPGVPPFPSMEKPRAFENYVCPFQYWKKPQYHCYWNTLTPNMSVAYVFGPLAVTRFGTDITLLQALNGKADPDRTLLREAVTALLNSYYSLRSFNFLDVSNMFDSAIVGSNRTVMLTAKRFKKANSFNCNFKPCLPA